MGLAIKHYLNPLHVYCRLRDAGLSKGAASNLCRIYEEKVFRKCIRILFINYSF